MGGTVEGQQVVLFSSRRLDVLRVLKTVGMLACLVLLPTLAFAQASITGVVRDSSGAVLPGVC